MPDICITRGYILMAWQVTHIILHIIVPGIAAYLLFPRQWKRAWLIMALTMLVDLDHLLADPVYDPARCSIGFHPLHSYAAIGAYLVLSIVPGMRIIAAGLIIHMALDWHYCWSLLR